MKYSVHVKEGKNPQQFLQSSDHLANVKKGRYDLDRWMYQMGVVIKDWTSVTFLLYENGNLILTKSNISGGSWRKPTT